MEPQVILRFPPLKNSDRPAVAAFGRLNWFDRWAIIITSVLYITAVVLALVYG